MLNNPWGLAALVAVTVIIILYLLKQKREDYVFSSLYLWQNAVRDMEANAPWQKLKRNLLMFLEIFAVILLALLLSEPVIMADAGDKSVIIVIDCSLSMQSTDVKPTRFERAVSDAVELVEASRPGTEFTLISSGNKPYILLNKVSDKKKVIQEIKSIKASDISADIKLTVDLVNTLTSENSGTRVNWFSDGVSPVDDENINYYSYNGNGDNYAVTLLSYRKLENNKEITALSRITNFSARDAEMNISFYTDGMLFDARRVTVGAGKSESLYWTDIPETSTLLECRIDTPDILENDNISGVVVSPEKEFKVLLATEKNIFLDRVLSLIPNLDLYRTDKNEASNMTGYDLYVFDGQMPEKLPEDGHAILFNPGSNDYFTRLGDSEYTSVQLSDHKIYDGLDKNTSFSAAKTALYRLPEWGNPVMETDEGIAAFEGYIGKMRIFVFGFDLHETNLPVQPFFPVIMTRVVQQLLPGGTGGISSVYAGENVDLTVDPEANSISVITPDGNRVNVAPPFPAAAFNETSQTGLYTVEQQLESKTEKQLFYVNAPSEKEFTVSANENTVIQDTNENAGRKAPQGRSLKYLLLWMLLAILVVEWWVYTNGNTV